MLPVRFAMPLRRCYAIYRLIQVTSSLSLRIHVSLLSASELLRCFADASLADAIRYIAERCRDATPDA